MQQVASKNAPSPSVVVPHFVFGGIVWLLVTVLIFSSPQAFTQHYFNPMLLSITHLVVLGWISMVIFGALYQLLSVIMEVKLYSEKLAFISFGLLGIGTLLLAISFWNFWLGIPMRMAAVLLLLAVLFFAVNVFRTGNKSPKKSIEKRCIQTAVVWLLFTVIAGFVLVVNLAQPFISTPHLALLKLHAHMGIIGWFMLLIMGVSSRLFPMFMVSHQPNTQKLRNAYFLINTGLIIAVFCLFFQWNTGLIVSVVVVVLGIIYFLSFMLEVYRKRLKKRLDIGMKQSVFSLVVLLLPIAIIAVLNASITSTQSITSPMAIVYGSSLLIGFITSLILGQTYKTLPFIIWLKVYRKRVGKEKIPFPKELYSDKVAHLQFWGFMIGFIIFLMAILLQSLKMVQIGGVLLFISALFYNYNLLTIVFHKPNGQD